MGNMRTRWIEFRRARRTTSELVTLVRAARGRRKQQLDRRNQSQKRGGCLCQKLALSANFHSFFSQFWWSTMVCMMHTEIYWDLRVGWRSAEVRFATITLTAHTEIFHLNLKQSSSWTVTTRNALQSKQCKHSDLKHPLRPVSWRVQVGGSAKL